MWLKFTHNAKKRHIQWAAVLLVETLCWWSDRKAMLTQVISLSSRGEEKRISACTKHQTMRWRSYNSWSYRFHSCQKTTGTWDYSREITGPHWTRPWLSNLQTSHFLYFYCFCTRYIYSIGKDKAVLSHLDSAGCKKSRRKCQRCAKAGQHQAQSMQRAIMQHVLQNCPGTAVSDHTEIRLQTDTHTGDNIV